MFGNRLPWYAENDVNYRKHIFYHIGHCILELFRSPNKKEVSELSITDTMNTILNGNGTLEGNVDTLKELAKLHRITENTKARKRLEKWSSITIITYLVIVLVLVFFNYTTRNSLNYVRIPNEIVIAILTTTTVNIISFMIIVLRGHFLSGEKDKQKQQKEE